MREVTYLVWSSGEAGIPAGTEAGDISYMMNYERSDVPCVE